MICWLNGQLLAVNSAQIPITDRGFLLGDGVYETIRIVNGEAQWLSRHLARLSNSMQLIGLPRIHADPEQVIQDVLHANCLRNGVVRITLTRGSGPRGLAPPVVAVPTLLVTAFHATPPLRPARIIISTRTRRNEHSPLAGIKSLNCLDSIIARLEADAAGADDAVLCNTAGNISETTTANIFAVIDGALVTPPLSSGCLPGITRGRILETGAREMLLTPGMLMSAEEIFLTTSLGIRPVNEIAGQVLSNSTEVGKKLSHLLFSEE